MPWRARAWFIGVWGCLALLLVFGAGVLPRFVSYCHATLTSTTEPDGWREWPVADPAAAGRGVCPRTGIPPVFFDPADAPARPELWIRRDERSGVLVVGAVPATDESPRERFLGAYRREDGPNLRFTSSGGAVFVLSLGLALATLIAGIATATGRLRATRRLAESMRRAHLSMACDSEGYRRPATPQAQDAAEVAYRAQMAEGVEHAVWPLRTALLAVAGLCALLMVVLWIVTAVQLARFPISTSTPSALAALTGD
jgi:hypothetical protein